MKKTILFAMAILMVFAMMPNQLYAADANDDASLVSSVALEAEAAEAAEAEVLLERLEELESMDKSEMNSAEKKELRKEVRSIKNDLKALGGGVYLSVGALIIVILLLILLL